MFKQIVIGIGSSVGAAFVIWLIAKSTVARDWFNRQRADRQAIVTAVLAVLVSTVFTTIWTGVIIARFQDWPSPAPDLGKVVQADLSTCKSGYYVTGVKTTDASGGGGGYMKTLQVECRKLNVDGR